MLFLAALVPLLVVQIAMLAYFVSIGRRARAFVSPNGSEASDFALAIDAMADRAVVRMKMAVLGEKGGDAKAARAAEDGMTRDLVSATNPMLAMGLDAIMPKWARYLSANPALLPKAMEIMSKYGGGKADAHGPGVVIEDAKPVQLTL